MNIKNIKALKEKEVYGDNFCGGSFICEDMKEKDRCMPYHFYPVPKTDDLIGLIMKYYDEDIAIKIECYNTLMGWIGYTVKIPITFQDTVEQKFTSEFLDDALAEALLALKENSDEKKKASEDLEAKG